MLNIVRLKIKCIGSLKDKILLACRITLSYHLVIVRPSSIYRSCCPFEFTQAGSPSVSGLPATCDAKAAGRATGTPDSARFVAMGGRVRAGAPATGRGRWCRDSRIQGGQAVDASRPAGRAGRTPEAGIVPGRPGYREVARDPGAGPRGRRHNSKVQDGGRLRPRGIPSRPGDRGRV